MTEAAAVSSKLTVARGERAATLYPWSTRDSITRLNPLLPIALRSADWQQAIALLKTANPPGSQPNLQLLNSALTQFADGMLSLNEKDVDSAGKHSTELDAQLWQTSQKVDAQNASDNAKPKPDASAPKNEAEPVDPNLPNLLKNLAIMSLELRAAISVETGNTAEAETLYSQARHEEQDLGYREPPAFIQPVAEQEAAFLTATGQSAEAEKAWKKALEDRPNSGFPLYGLAELAERSGRASQATVAYGKFLEAWKSADPELAQIQHAHQWLADHPDRALAANSGAVPVDIAR